MSSNSNLTADENSPHYYGWVVLAAATVGMTLSSGPMLFGSIGLFVSYFESTFGWSRSEIMLALSFNTIATVISAPICGRLIDRFGARQVLLPSILAFVVIWASVPFFTGSLILFYTIIFMLGLFTVGTQSISYIRVISAWFDKKYGLAIGIAASGLGLSYMLTPLIVRTVFEYAPWYCAYWVLAAIVLFISFPLMYFAIQNSPKKTQQDTNKTKEQYGLSLKESIRVREFWLIGFTILVFSLILTGLIPHIVPIMLEQGVDIKTAAQVASIMGFTTFIGRIGVGYLVDKIFAPYIAILFFGGAVAGLFILSSGTTGSLALFAAAIIGLGFGAESDLIGYFVNRYFGLKAFAEIYGYIYCAFLIGAGTGPFLLGLGHDILGQYNTLLLISAYTGLISCGAFLLLRPFPHFVKNN